MSDSIAQYLASQAEGTFVSEGEFQLSPAELARKLGDSLAQPQNWVLKFVQASTVLKARRVQLKIGRQWMRVEFELPDYFLLGSAQEFLESSPTNKAHSHLLYGLLCSVNLFTSEEVHLLWTCADGRLCRISSQEKRFTLGSRSSPPESTLPYLGFALKRRSMSTFEKIFQRASFGPEYRVLQERAKLYPGNLILDGRPLGEWTVDKASSEVSLVCLAARPTSEEPSLNLCWKRMSGLEDYPKPKGPYRRDLLLEILYSEPDGTKVPCTVAWILDGVVIQEEILLPGDSTVGFRLYLPADGLKTDLSTFGLVEDDTKHKRLHSTSLRDWLNQAMVWAEGYCLSKLASQKEDSLAELLMGRLKAPVDRFLLTEGLRRRRHDIMQYLHR